MTAQTDLLEAARAAGVEIDDSFRNHDRASMPGRRAVARELKQRGVKIAAIGSMLGYSTDGGVRHLLDYQPRPRVEAVKKSAKAPDRPPAHERTAKLPDVVTLVCDTIGVELAQVQSAGRMPRVVLARGLVAWLGRQCTDASYPAIARATGRPTHTTVIDQERRTAAQIAAGDKCAIDLGGERVSVAELAGRLKAQLTG